MQAEPSKNKHEQSLEDRGWTDMSAILEREMPVEKRKKRVLLLLLLLIGLGLGIGFSFWLSQQFIEKNDVVAIVEVAEKQTALIKEERAAIDNNDNKIAVQKATKIDESLKPNRLNESKNTLTTRRIATERNTSFIQQEKTASPLSIEKVLEESSTAKQIEAIKESNITSITEKPTTETPFAAVDVLNSSFPLSLEEKEGEPRIKQETNRGDDWSFLANSGVLLPLKTSPHLFAGLRVDYQIKRNWSLQTGVDIVSPSLDTRFNDELYDSSFGIFRGQNGSNTTATNADMDSTIGLYQIRNQPSLRLPVQLMYRIKGRWQAQIGVSYLMPFDNNEEEEMIAADVTTTTTFNPVKQTSIQTTSRWQWQAGFTYHLSERWSIESSYQQSFLQQESPQVLNRFGQLSVQYRIK